MSRKGKRQSSKSIKQTVVPTFEQALSLFRKCLTCKKLGDACGIVTRRTAWSSNDTEIRAFREVIREFHELKENAEFTSQEFQAQFEQAIQDGIRAHELRLQRQKPEAPVKSCIEQKAVGRAPITIFCDGASDNPGFGSYGFIISDGKTVVEGGGTEVDSTCNRAETLAAIAALTKLGNTEGDVTLYSDSEFVVKGISGWMERWKRDGWKLRKGERLKNPDLWVRLDRLLEARKMLGYSLKADYVPGHAGINGNERADAIASAFFEGREIALADGIPVESYPIDLTDLNPHPEQASKKFNWKNANRTGRKNRVPRDSKTDAYVSLLSYIVYLVRGNLANAAKVYEEYKRCSADQRFDPIFPKIYLLYSQLSVLDFLKRFEGVNADNLSQFLTQIDPEPSNTKEMT